MLRCRCCCFPVVEVDSTRMLSEYLVSDVEIAQSVPSLDGKTRGHNLRVCYRLNILRANQRSLAATLCCYLVFCPYACGK